MQIEKRLIACSILAIAIGIATIVPLEYMMGAEAQVNAELPKVEPWFNVNVTYAYCNPNQNGGNNTMTFDGAMIQAVANFTVTPNALKDADAQIEYYQFAVSSDQGPIVNMGYYIVIEANQDIVTGIGPGITFANGLTYNGPATNGGQAINYAEWNSSYTLGFVSDYIFSTNGNDTPQAVTALRNAQTLYIDVSKVCTVTVNGNVTVTTPASHDILQHIELTKIGSEFVYGTYAEGTLPIPGVGPSTP
jgi:hypothetical protein